MSEFEEAKWPRQIIGAAIIGMLILVLCFVRWRGFLPSLELLFFIWGPVFLTPLSAVGGVWFGGWAILTVLGVLFSTLSFWPLAYTQPPVMSLQALIPAWAFRYFKGDPRLRAWRDRMLFVVFGAILPSLVSTYIMLSNYYVFYWPPLIPNLDVLYQVWMPRWFLSSLITTLIIGFPLLLWGSGIVINVKAYCKGWFS